MTAADLARIAAAIDADQRQTDVSSWPLSRERTRAYLALARAVAEWVSADIETGAMAWPEGHDFYDTETRVIFAALSALAPDADAGEAAGEAGEAGALLDLSRPTCDDCGGRIVDHTLICGAPQCCDACCADGAGT